MPKYNLAPDQIELCQKRLVYFEGELAKSAAAGIAEEEYPRSYYRTEVAERTLLLALWEHLLDAGEPRTMLLADGRVLPIGR